MTLAKVDRLLQEEVPGDLSSTALEDLRARRDECQQAEVSLSYLRRLAQGRLDIVAAELRRRSEGKDAGHAGELVEELPEILGRGVTSAGPGRLPTSLAPDDEDDPVEDLDAVIAPAALASLHELDDDAVRELADQIAAFERDVSDRRRSLHERIDVLQAELVRRYKSGEATVDSLLT